MAKLEDNFEKLEQLIDDMENNDMSLEDLFHMYEQGMKLLASCNKEIDKVEKKLIILKEGSDGTAEGKSE